MGGSLVGLEQPRKYHHGGLQTVIGDAWLCRRVAYKFAAVKMRVWAGSAELTGFVESMMKERR